MRILAFDTATRSTAVALLDTDGAPALELRDDPPPGSRPRHTALLMALTVRALDEHGIDWDGIGRIGVGIGPGTFTGLRIGVAAARALSAARGIPLTGVSTLRSLASAAERAAGGSSVLAVIDARRGEAFAAGWTAVGAGSGAAPSLAACALPPGELAGRLAGLGGDWLAVGDGAVAFRETLERAGARVPADDDPLHLVSAGEHCRLAARATPGRIEEVLPDYLRAPDARPAAAAATAG